MHKTVQNICSVYLKHVLLALLVFTVTINHAQKVGLVLSGGGASGLAHIGVIKALEENNIPIDYITGTSMGAFIGAMYAAGYSPEEMEKIATSPDFQRIATGAIDSKFMYFFKQQMPEASWITFRFTLDTSIITSIPTHLVSPIPIDFALLKYFTGASSAAGNSFNNLFVPFRCVAADIVEKKPHIFDSGNLGEAVRASISYPFYLKPLIIDGRMLFDGGLYNNFPTDIMQDNFHPDLILGSNVSGNIAPPTDDNILSEIKNMLMTKTNYMLDSSKGTIIIPNVEAGILTADHPKALIDSGYNATMRKMPYLLKIISRRVNQTELAERRKAFKAKQHDLNFNGLTMEGLNSAQKRYIRSILFDKKGITSLNEMEKRYYKVATDPDIHSVYPLASQKDTSGYYNLDVVIKKEKHFSASFGGVISNRPISEGYVGAQYSYMGKEEMDILGNTYFGKLYTSALGTARIYFPTSLPFYIEPGIIYNRWDYFTSSTEFFEDIQPPYLTQNDEYGKFDIGVPLGMSTKLVAGASLTNIISRYYLSKTFAPTDTSDRTEFDAVTEYLKIETNTLNRKEYASAGTRIFLQAQYVNGKEYYYPGSKDISKQEIIDNHEWAQLKFSFDNYYKQRGLLRLGIYLEGVYTYNLYPMNDPLQTYFTNYNATALMAPAFQPTPESQTLFLANYRAYNYLAGGPKLIVSFKPKIDLRFEGYIFLPYQSINDDPNTNMAVYDKPLSTKHYIGVASIVYNSPVGPMALSVNYYDGQSNNLQNSFSILFHIGYIIFNPKSVN